MKKEHNARQRLLRTTISHGGVFSAALVVSEAASARVSLGIPDPSMVPMWGAAAVIGVVAYRLNKNKNKNKNK